MQAHYLQYVPFEGLGSIEPWLHGGVAFESGSLFQVLKCTNKGWLLSGDKFKQEIADHVNCRLSPGGGGDRRLANNK
jgi:hypothetical protein